MEKTIEEALLALATSTSKRKKTGVVRGLLPQVKAAKAAGVTDQKIVETLQNQGVDISLYTFKSILYRLRKKKVDSGVDPAEKISVAHCAADKFGVSITPGKSSQKQIEKPEPRRLDQPASSVSKMKALMDTKTDFSEFE